MNDLTIVLPASGQLCPCGGVGVRYGYYYRKDDQRQIQKYRCKTCYCYFSQATGDPDFGQHRRTINSQVAGLLASLISQRRLAIVLSANHKTIVRKFLLLGERAKHQFSKFNEQFPQATEVQFDELETIEHTKCKPVSVPLMVEKETRRILGFSVAQMPAKGKIAKISRKKYGRRVDHRRRARSNLFKQVRTHISNNAKIESDQNPAYPDEIKLHFPQAQHHSHKGQRGSTSGQGELKKIRFDPLFSLNHTCAQLRANINRLIRKTWCTTKRIDRLELHIYIYALFHNLNLDLRKNLIKDAG